VADWRDYVSRTEDGPAVLQLLVHAYPVVDVLALPLFVLLNLAILALFVATLRLLLLGKLFMK
jgi:hypothetical protein